MKAINMLIIGIHFFVGIGAFAGGLTAVLDPSSPLNIPVDMMKKGPFEDYLIPGLTLMCVIGIGNLGAALAAIRKLKYNALITGAMGAILVGWIVIQCIILESVIGLHVAFFLIGALQGFLALFILYKENLFPLNIVKKFLKLP